MGHRCRKRPSDISGPYRRVRRSCRSGSDDEGSQRARYTPASCPLHLVWLGCENRLLPVQTSVRACDRGTAEYQLSDDGVDARSASVGPQAEANTCVTMPMARLEVTHPVIVASDRAEKRRCIIADESMGC